MSAPDNEQRLAEALARYLDGEAAAPPELGSEVETLDGIERTVSPDALPERLSGHRILSEIGSGGMGRVLLARDEALGRQVAIKTLGARYAGDATLRARFLNEARAMARLNHPNIVRIYNLGPPDEPAHFVMEYVEGAPLTRAAARLTFQQKAELMRKVALAVEFLHSQGIIHRDLKPANVLVDSELEPKLLDFGLALELGEDETRLSRPGEVAGTPQYFSPEQARAERALDARSDVFSLGAILYELLTGEPPFAGGTVREIADRICQSEPVLPRRREAGIPRELQSICLKALEKDPADRYRSARELADDLRRFLAGDAVIAAPGAYARLIGTRVAEHLKELESWWREQILSDSEFDGLRKRYAKLADREDAWIMEARRLTLPQVGLYLGAWVLATGAALLTLVRYASLSGAPAIAAVIAAAAPTAWIGVRTWRQGHFRVAIAYLLAFCLLLPVAAIVTMGEAGIVTAMRPKWELFPQLGSSRPTTNAQLWWALALSLPVYAWLRRFTRASVFSLVIAAGAALLALVTLLRLGMLEWLDTDPGRVYLHLIPCGVLFLAAGFELERRRKSDDSRYFYPLGVAFTWAALSGIALFHAPYANWLRSVAPWTRGQIEYLFILNAVIYFALDLACGRLGLPQLRVTGKAFRFVLPGHVLTSLWLLGVNATEQFESRLLECLLPAVACVFVFGAIPKQMKNFFATGLLFVAIGIVRLQRDLFRDAALWPLALLAAGLLLMVTAANYAPIRVTVGRFFRK